MGQFLPPVRLNTASTACVPNTILGPPVASPADPASGKDLLPILNAGRLVILGGGLSRARQMCQSSRRRARLSSLRLSMLRYSVHGEHVVHGARRQGRVPRIHTYRSVLGRIRALPAGLLHSPPSSRPAVTSPARSGAMTTNTRGPQVAPTPAPSTARPVNTGPDQLDVVTVSMNPDRTMMACGTASGRVVIYEKTEAPAVGDDTVRIRSGNLGHGDSGWRATFDAAMPGGDRVTCTAWVPQVVGDVLAAGAADGTVAVWERSPVDAGDTAWSLTGACDEAATEATCMAFAPAAHGPWLAVGFRDGYVRTYQPRTPGAALSWGLTGTLSPGLGIGGAMGPDRVTGLAWRPQRHGDAAQPTLACATSPAEPRTATPPHLAGAGGSCSCWFFHHNANSWLRASSFAVGPCTAVDWAGSFGRDFETVAVAQGERVLILAVRGSLDKLEASVLQEISVPAAAWKVEWDAFGLDLACCLEDASVALWELRLDGKWAPAMEKGQTLDREWLGDQQLAHAIAVDDTMGVE